MLDALPRELALAYMAVLGAALGSFANVVIARLPEGESVVRPRSRCPACRAPIAWYDNLPLVSWLWLRARCRRCGARIPARYFIVELLMAGLATALWVQLGWSLELLLWLPLTTALVIITFLDIDHWWVPDVITFPAMGVVALASLLPGGLTPLESLLGLAPALLIWAVAWVFARVTGHEGLGLGDVKLLALIGLALGAPAGLGVLVLAALQGSVVGILVLLTGGHRGVEKAASAEPPEATHAEGEDEEDEWVPHPHAIPFGPFLVLATLEVVLLPSLFADLPGRISELLLQWLA